VACFLHQDVTLLKWYKGANAIDELSEALTGLLKFQCWTGFKMFIPLQQSVGDKPSNMLKLHDINANVQGLIQVHGNYFQVRIF